MAGVGWLVFSSAGATGCLAIGAVWGLLSRGSLASRRFLALCAACYWMAGAYIVPETVRGLLAHGYTPLTRADVPAGRTAVVVLGSGSHQFRDWSEGQFVVIDQIGAARLLEAARVFRLPRTSILNPLSTARFFSPSGLSVSYTTPTTEALVVDRAVFDQNLFELAREAGATIALGCRVSSIDVHDAGVVVMAGDTRYEARAVVLACGANYSLHRKLGLGMPAAYLRSAQLELKAERHGDVEVHFGNHVAPQGFAWVVPVNRGDQLFARVGLMCESDASSHFRRFAAQVSESWGLTLPVDANGDITPRQKMLPLAPIERTYADRVLAVGDAAGLVKATTGGGIYYSLVSASIAANVLAPALRTNTLDARTLSRYQKEWQRRLGNELKAQYSLRELAERMGDAEIDGLFDLAQTNGVMPIVRRTARFNQHRNLIVSLLKHAPARRLLVKEFASRVVVSALG